MTLTKLEEQKRRVWNYLHTLEQLHNIPMDSNWEHYNKNQRRFTPVRWVELVYNLKRFKIPHEKEDIRFDLRTYQQRDYLKNWTEITKLIAVKDYLAPHYKNWVEVELKI